MAERSRSVCANVYEAAHALGESSFDIVYVSFGSLGWLPSVERWAGQVGALLCPHGRALVHDMHPPSDDLARFCPVLRANKPLGRGAETNIVGL